MQNRRYNAAMRVGSRIGRGSGKQLEPGYEVFLNYTFNTAGAHSVTASYGGDALNATSVSMPVAETVTIATSTMVIAANQSPPGKAYMLTATVSGALPTGTVTFMSGTTVLGTATVAAGKATLQYTFAGAGPYSLSASYSGDANNTACVSPTITVTPSTAQTYYIHTDQLDTPRVITDTAGNKVWEWQNSDPFGNNMPDQNPSNLGTFEFDLRFPGQVADKETNAFYNFFRDAYDPALDRYTQSDPIGLMGGINTYAYVGENPISLTDALGLCPAAKCVGEPYKSFFVNNYGPASNVGDKYKVDPSLLLGLAAAESGYGTSSMATSQNNPFGATPGGFNTPGITYDSYSSAWQNWGNQWGARVSNVDGDANQFITNLARDNQGVAGGSDTRGPYNTQDATTGGNPNWSNLVLGTISGVRRRLPLWLRWGC